MTTPSDPSGPPGSSGTLGSAMGAATLEEVQELVSLQLGVARVAPGDRLVEELGAESADVANIVAALEDRYGVTIGEEELPELRTVEDLYRRVERER